MAADRDDEEVIFAIVDANLDTNPKVRRAGNLGRQVFEFVLRRNALRGSKGFIPASFVDADYLADMLMVTCDDARRGVTAAVTARLIAIDEAAQVVHIVGWHPSWGRRPKDGKTRTKEWRQRRESKPPEPQERVTVGDELRHASSHVTVGDECDGSEGEVEGEKIDQNSLAARARAIPPSTEYQAAEPRQRGDLATRFYAQLSDARVRVAADLGLHDVLPLPPGGVGSEPRAFRDLRERIREEGALAPQVCDLVLKGLIAQAVETRSVEWLSEKALTEGGWRTARTGPPAARAGPRPASRTGAIGAATPRTDHPEGTDLVPISELLR